MKMKSYILSLLCMAHLLCVSEIKAQQDVVNINQSDVIMWRTLDVVDSRHNSNLTKPPYWKRSPMNLFQCDRSDAHTLRFTSAHTVSATLYVVSDDVVLESKSLVITKDAPVVLHMENDLTACTLYLTIGDCIYESIS